MSLHVPAFRTAPSRDKEKSERFSISRPGLKTRITIGVLFTLMALYASAAAPTLTASGTISYPEGSPNVVVSSGIVVADPDGTIASASVQISGFSAGQEVLTF